MSKRTASKKDASDVIPAKKSRSSKEIPSNSEARIILFAITCFEWQAVYLEPALFAPLDNPISLTRAVRAQCRDWGEYKPSIKWKIYNE